MVNVLADLALESEAAIAAALRIARAFDARRRRARSPSRRLALAVMKYWICKRGAPFAAEALECLGGNGYIEEAPMAQFYRDIQIGTVWEGSGNVIALDVLRALATRARGRRRVHGRVRARRAAPTRASTRTSQRVRDGARRRCARRARSGGARALVEDLALALQAGLLLRTRAARRRRRVLRRDDWRPTATWHSDRSHAVWTARRSLNERWRSDTQA